MKYIITEVHWQRLNNLMFKHFDIMFNPEEILYTNFTEHDEDGNEYLEKDHYSFYYKDSYDTGVFEWFGPEYYDSEEDAKMREKSPILAIDFEKIQELNDTFGNKWRQPFKQWFKDTFGLDVKTIS